MGIGMFTGGTIWILRPVAIYSVSPQRNTRGDVPRPLTQVKANFSLGKCEIASAWLFALATKSNQRF